MEPAAPGTEDDAVQPTLSKREADDERLLSIKAHLPFGRYGNVFSKSYNDGMEQWYCNICECPVMGRMFHHETGKRHTQQISKLDPRRNKDRYAKDDKLEEEKPAVKEEETLFSKMGSGLDQAKINVAPGEPVPPGEETEATKVAQIQDRLDKFKASALLGLEYLLEITDYDLTREPSYLCALCDKKGDPRTVIAHLVSYNHLQQFMQRHFPSTYRALSPFITRQYRKNWQDTMNSIAEAIEAKYGRLLPHPVDKDTFERKKDFFYQMIHHGPHFSEKNGISFEHMVKPEEITKNAEEDMTAAEQKKRSPSPPVVAKPTAKRLRSNPDNIRGRRNSLSSVSSISSNELNDTVAGDGAARDAGRRGRNRSPRVRGNAREGRAARRTGSGSKSMSISPENNVRKNSRSRSRSRTRYQNTSNSRYNSSYRGAPRGSYNSRYSTTTNSNATRRSRSPRTNKRSRTRSRSPRSSRPPWERSNYSNRALINRSPPPKVRETITPKTAGAATVGDRSDVVGRMERARVERESKEEEYKRLCKAIENDMNRVLKGHEKNPEKHKDYNEEWKLFWNKRYKELQLEGKDAANFDFKPEWIIVWNKRMMELHNVEVKAKKDALRKRLGLRDEPAPISFRIGKYSPSKGPAPVAAQPDQDHEVIVIDDKEDDTPIPNNNTITVIPAATTMTHNKERENKSPTRSHSPWETDVPVPSQPQTVSSVERERKTVKTVEVPKSLSRSREEPNPVRRTEPNPSASSRRVPSSNRDRSRDRDRSNERDLPRKRSPPPTREREQRSNMQRQTSRDRDTRDIRDRDRDRVIGLDRDGRDSRDRERRYDSRDRDGGRRSRGEDRLSWERDRERRGRMSRSPISPSERDRYYRSEHPRERDHRDPDYFSRERSWERVINQHREMRLIPPPHPAMVHLGQAPIPEEYLPPMIMRDVTSTPMYIQPRMPMPNMGMSNMGMPKMGMPVPMPMHRAPPSPEIEIPDEDATIVSVLRLLTALEEMLGSLGPKIIEMLANALGMEKNEPNSSEMMLDNEINCVLFETVKEKLKGRLQTGLVTYKQEKAVKHAIKSLASLIHQSSERKRLKQEQIALNPLTVPGIGVVDKAAIAKQIATALVLQGKTDVTQGELEQLINAVVGMAEASKNSDTPINTATFLTKCREKSPEFTPKIIIPTVMKEKEKERLKKLEQEAAKKPEEENNSMEGLSDSDLQTLLQNFKDLSTEEQHGLISYLKKLEAREPQRVEKLRQFVNMGKTDSNDDQEKLKMDNELDEFGAKKSANSETEDLSTKGDQTKIKFDSDEEDYSYEDVFKAAKQNVTKKEKEKAEEKARKKAELEEEEKKNMEINLDQAKMIIANLMGTISKAAEAQAAQSAQSAETPKPNASNLLGFITSTANALNDVKQQQQEIFEEPIKVKIEPCTIKDLAKSDVNISESPILSRPTSQMTSQGPSSANSNSNDSGRINFEPPNRFELPNRTENQQNSIIRDPNLTGASINREVTNQIMSKMTSGGGGGSMNSMMGQNRFEFRPQQQQSGGGGQIPPPPPQPPSFQGGNPFGMISYPTPNVNRGFSGGQNFGGYNNDPQIRPGFNPFQDQGPPRTGFNNMGNMQNQHNQRGGYNNNNNNNNRW